MPYRILRIARAEVQLARLLFADFTLKEIASELGVSHSTVKNRLATLRRKFRCRTNHGLVFELVKFALAENGRRRA